MSSTARHDRSSTCTRSFRIDCIPLLTGLLFADTFIFLLTRSRGTRRFRQELLSHHRCLQRKIYRITVGQIFVLVRREGGAFSVPCARLQVVDMMVDGNCDRETPCVRVTETQKSSWHPSVLVHGAVKILFIISAINRERKRNNASIFRHISRKFCLYYINYWIYD